MHERAAAAGIDPAVLADLAAPVPVEEKELGIAAGRSPDDETAAYLMSRLLLGAVATNGQLVLTGVVQDKSSGRGPAHPHAGPTTSWPARSPGSGCSGSPSSPSPRWPR